MLIMLCNFSHTQGNLNYISELSNIAPNTLSLFKNESAMWEIITPKDSFNYPDKVHSLPLCFGCHIPFFNLLKPTGYMMHQQFNIQQLYSAHTVFMCFVFIWE
jgi:hypothetical protein